jgi:beta-lactamase regulating signal transducer with metallopeptidase domain
MNAGSYLITSTICLSLCFGVYKLVYRNENNFKQLRFFLLASVFISLIFPLSKVEIKSNFVLNKKVVQTITVQQPEKSIIPAPSVDTKTKNITTQVNSASPVKITDILLWVYFLVALALIIRILIQLTVISYLFAVNKKIKRGNAIIIRNSRFKSTFSFFNIIFLNYDSITDDDLEKILAHENVHVKQLHSFDLILIELLAAVMWFNPFVWMLKKEMQLIHEYLADEGALSTGIDRLGYQALLVNQATEESLICLSSSFNPAGRIGGHSLIKKRMIMMTKSKLNQGTRLKILALIPLAVVLFLGIACVNGHNKKDVEVTPAPVKKNNDVAKADTVNKASTVAPVNNNIAATEASAPTNKNEIIATVAPTKMNILYVGIDNPLRIEVSGYDPSKIFAAIDNGIISKQNGGFFTRPSRAGIANIIVNCDRKIIQRATFRVKTVPDPVAKVAGISGSGSIDKATLLQQTGITAELENFDFDVEFKIVSFTISTVLGGFPTDKKCKGNKFTQEQIKIFEIVNKGQKIAFTDIMAVSRDGIIRPIGPIVLTIK